MADCTESLRKWLDQAVSQGAVSEVETHGLPSHSCKNLLLLVFGSRLQSRHTSVVWQPHGKTHAAWMAYSVERMAGPLREMGVVLERVSAGRLVDLKNGPFLDSREGASSSLGHNDPMEREPRKSCQIADGSEDQNSGNASQSSGSETRTLIGALPRTIKRLPKPPFQTKRKFTSTPSTVHTA